MSAYLEVTIQDIKALHANQFRDLLAKLLYAEIMLHKITSYDFRVPTKEYTADGGIDGHFTTTIQHNSNFIKYNKNAYQIKAEKLTKEGCIKEVIKARPPKRKTKQSLNPQNTEKPELKPEVNKALEEGFTYILFIQEAYVTSGINTRKEALKETFQDNGFNNAEVEIIDGERIKDWVNTFPVIINYVKSCLGQDHNDSFKTVDLLKETKLYGGNDYILTPFLEKKKEEVINYLNSNVSESFRIIGNSGTGKSRFLIETIMSVEELKANTLYIDLADFESPSPNIVTNFIAKINGKSCILVVDNCSSDNHKKINELNNRSNLIRLITIDNKKDEFIKDTVVLNLNEEEQNEVVKNMLKPVLNIHNASHSLDHLVTICGGYPLLAKSLIEAINKSGLDGVNLGNLLDSGDLKKLLFNHFSENAKEITILYMLSFFVYIRFKHNKLSGSLIDISLDNQIKLQNQFLCKIFLESNGINEDSFNHICNKLISKSIIEYRGTLINIKPLPLSISLLQNAIEEYIFDFDKTVKPLLKTLESGEPYLRNLGDAFIKQVNLSMLPENHSLKTYVYNLLGTNSPFAQAENLLTSWGSIVLRRITEIAPNLSVQILNNALSSYNKDNIIQINSNVRRNIIFALEYLCLYEETFEDASEIMLRFGIAETEALANNSQELFIKLFTLYLSGTEATYEQRVSLLGKVQQKYNHDADDIIIRSIAQAFFLGPYYRLSNARHQLKELSDYQPKTNEEVIQYWESLITILLNLINNKKTDLKLIIEALNNIILQSLLRARKFDEVNQIIENIKDKYPEEKFIKTIRRLEEYKEYDPGINQDHINELIKKLSPTSLIDKIELDIINKRYLTNPDKEQEYRTIQSQLAQLLIEAKNNEETILKLVEANTFNVWEFGNEIAETNPNYAEQVIHDFTEKYITLNDLDNKTPFFIMGLVHGLNNDRSIFSYLVEKLLKKEAYKLVFIVTSMYPFAFDDFIMLVTLSKAKNLPEDYFNYLQFQNFSVTNKVKVVNILWQMNNTCKSKCVEIVSFGLNNNIHSDKFLISFWKLIRKDNIFILGLNSHLDYQINMILQKLLDKGKIYATVIARQLYEYCRANESNYPQTHYWNNLFIRLINEHYELMWNKYLGKIFLDSWKGEFFVVHTIANRKLNIICNTPEKIDNLIKWCSQNEKKKAHVRIARNILLRIRKKEQDNLEDKILEVSSSLGQDTPSIPTKWNDAILALLKKYDDDLFLGAIITNLSSYFLAGDQASLYYFKCAEYLEELKGQFSLKINQWIASESNKFRLTADKNKQQEEEFSAIAETEI